MDPLSMLLGAAAASAVWAVAGFGVRRPQQKKPPKPRQCIAQWYEKRTDWVCTKVAHPDCRSRRCRRHCKIDLCGCLTENRLEAEVLKELRAVTEEKS